MIWSGGSHGGGGGEVVDVLWSVPMLMSKVSGSESKVSDVVGTGMFAVCRDVETGSDYCSVSPTLSRSNLCLIRTLHPGIPLMFSPVSLHHR